MPPTIAAHGKTNQTWIQVRQNAVPTLNTSTIIDVLSRLNADNPVDWAGNLNDLCERNLASIDIAARIEEKANLVALLVKFNSDDQCYQWKYLCVNFYYLTCLAEALHKNDKLSVQESKQLCNIIRNVLGVGILLNLLPNLPYRTKLPSEEKSPAVHAFAKYKRLAAATFGFCTLAKFIELRPLIVQDYLKWILSALYQILYCPLKKPSDVPDPDGFVMTEELYQSLLNDRKIFEPFLKDLQASTHKVLYVRETMMLLSKNSPMWLKRALSAQLTSIIRGPKGVESIAWAMLDAAGLDDPDDSAKSWKTLDVIAKIVMDTRKLPDFRENICRQLSDLLKLRSRTGEPIRPFERLFALCAKLLFQQDELSCREVFITRLLRPLLSYRDEAHNFSNGEIVTESLSQSMRLWHSSLLERSFNIPVLPVHLLTPAISVVFRIYSVTCNVSDLKNLNGDIEVVLLQILKELETGRIFEVFDNFLFGIPCESCAEFRSDIELVVENNCLSVKLNDYSVGFRPLKRAETLQHFLKEAPGATTTFFTYLLNCLINRDKYFNPTATKRDLLHLETEIVLDETAERHLAVYKLLSELAEDKTIQKHINEKPSSIVQYIEAVFKKTIETGTHKTDCETEGFQSLFLIIMLLQALIENTSKDHYKILAEPLEIISEECKNAELKELSKLILSKLLGGSQQGISNKNETLDMSELDKALEDIYDPLLPVRGHGLMTLVKLIEKKDTGALERKQYILNIFQQNLKNEDSFIYLSAVGGLAAMADVFTDTVLHVLAEEYSDFSGKGTEDGHEVRMKLGEVLVRTTRILGDMAPKYKTLLLNTFLVGTKDEDHLIRASSLSNLGEVCRILGYKLGSIATEVLVCVHAVITTDKAAEARRAAVTVIRQLFVGLEKEMIVFLKDEILSVYRTLKHIYYHDSDDVMRLQAQLALEQLNENMREFVFPNPQLHAEKKIVMLD